MSAIGDDCSLTPDEIKAAFEATKGEGKEFLLVVSYLSPSLSLGGMVEMFDINECAVGVSRNTVEADLKAMRENINWRCYDTRFVVGSGYALTTSFEDARKLKAADLPDWTMEEQRRQQAFDDLPWYKKLFSSPGF